MPEPTDAVLPILRRIQEDLAETGRELGRKIDGHTRILASHSETGFDRRLSGHGSNNDPRLRAARSE